MHKRCIIRVRKDRSKTRDENSYGWQSSAVACLCNLELHLTVARTEKQRCQCTTCARQNERKNHAKDERNRQPGRSQQAVDNGLKVRIRRVGSDRASEAGEEIDVFLLGMKNENPYGEQQCVDRKGDDAGRSSETRSACGRKDKPTFTAIEIDSECAGQHDAEKRDHPDENAEHTGFERGPNGDFSVERAGAIELPARRNLRRKPVSRGI